jgi:lactase-phlorizin hydrolase
MLFPCRSGSDWLKVTPVGIRRMLNWVKFTYGDFPIYITENGISDRNGSLEDQHRIFYYKHYINNVLKGIASLHFKSQKPTPHGSFENYEFVEFFNL